MHFEILVEDQSGEKALSIIIPKIIGADHSFRIKSYKGIGRIPKNLNVVTDASNRILLNQLPKLLKGYGKTFAKYPSNQSVAVIVICDLDNKCCKSFRQELLNILNSCNPKPETRFCIAIEEGEAWFLGDICAIKKAYPKAKDQILSRYLNDSICGTWEYLADAIYHGGSQSLKKKGWPVVGAEKSKWAIKISPHMNVELNKSPSFCYFKEKLRELIEK